MAAAALRSALLNECINLAYMHDEAQVEKSKAAFEKIEKESFDLLENAILPVMGWISVVDVPAANGETKN